MPKITKTDCWDMLEDKLFSLIESRFEAHDGAAKLAVAVLISAGRDQDIEFIKGSVFTAYCERALLDPIPTRALIEQTILFLENNTPAQLKERIAESNGLI